MTEIGVHGARRDHKEIVGYGDAVGDDALRTRVDRPHFRHEDGRVSLRREHMAYRPRDIRWRKSRRGNLIHQRLEAIMILTVDHRHVDRRMPQRLHGLDAAESRTDDDDSRSSRRAGGLIHGRDANTSSFGAIIAFRVQTRGGIPARRLGKYRTASYSGSTTRSRSLPSCHGLMSITPRAQASELARSRLRSNYRFLPA